MFLTQHWGRWTIQVRMVQLHVECCHPITTESLLQRLWLPLSWPTAVFSPPMPSPSQVLDKLHRQHGFVQDAMNIIYRLVNAGRHQTAHQVFATIPVPQASEGQQQAPFPGSFFIRHLVKSGTTVIVHFCAVMCFYKTCCWLLMKQDEGHWHWREN